MSQIMTQEEIDQAKELRANAWTYKAISDKMCYSTTAIYYQLRGERKNNDIYNQIPLKWFYNYFQEDKTRTISKLCVDIYGKWDKSRHYALQRLIMGQDVKIPVSNLAKLEALTGKTLTELLERR